MVLRLAKSLLFNNTGYCTCFMLRHIQRLVTNFLRLVLAKQRMVNCPNCFC